MKHTSITPARRATALAVLFWIVWAPPAARADGPELPEPVAASHCGTPPASRAEVVRGPRLGLDASTGRVVRRHATVPRYPCADAPQVPGWGVDAIEVLIDGRRPHAGPGGPQRWRRRAVAPR